MLPSGGTLFGWGGTGGVCRVCHLINRMTKLAQLIHTCPGLDIWMVAGTNGPHAGGFISCVALGGVLKVGIRPARTVDADVACGGNVRTPVGLGHDCHHRNP